MTEKWSESSSLHKNTPLGAVEHKETSDSENKYHFYAEDTNETNIMDETDLPGYLSKQYLPLYGMCFIVYLCSTMQGYDGSLMGSIYT